MAFGFLNFLDQGLTPQNTFQATVPLDANALNQQISNSQANFGQNQTNEQGLATALTAQMNGTGPNPAAQQLSMANNQATQQAAGLIGSDRGLDPALAAKMAAEGKAQMSQQTQGQMAQAGAQQQLNAQGQLQNLYGTIGNQNLQNVQTSGSLNNQSMLGAQQINAGTSAQNAAANQNTNSGLLGGAASALGLAHGGEVGYDNGGVTDALSNAFVDGNALSVKNPENPQNTNGMSFGNADASTAIANQMLKSAGVASYASGVNSDQLAQGIQNGFMKPSSATPNADKFVGAGYNNNQTYGTGAKIGFETPTAQNPGTASALGNFHFATGGKVPTKLSHFAHIYHPHMLALGGKVDVKVSPGEKYLSPKDAQKVADGKEDPKTHGKTIPGKAPVKGDSPKNDIVPAKAQKGGVVIPRTVMQSKDADQEKAFVADKLKEHGKGRGAVDFKETLKNAISTRKYK